MRTHILRSTQTNFCRSSTAHLEHPLAATTSHAGTYGTYSASNCTGTVSQSVDFDCDVDGAGLYNAANCENNTNLVQDTGLRYTWIPVAKVCAVATSTREAT